MRISERGQITIPKPLRDRFGMNHNVEVEITPTADGARGRGYWMVIDVLSHPPAIAAHAYWDDTFVKTANGWRIKTRTSQRGWPRLAKTQ